MRVGLRGGDGSLASAVEAADASVVDEEAADVVVAVEEEGLLSLAADVPDRPVLPVTSNERFHGVTASQVTRALETVLADDHRVVDHHLLDVTNGEETVGRAVMDVTLMTSQPARISEYAVRLGGDLVGQVRADGIVAAAPAGSDSYARAAGGPVLGAGTGVAVVPVSPFATQTDSWVLDLPVTLTVEREGPVALYLDDTFAREVVPEDSTRVESGPLVRFVRIPADSA